MKEKNRILILAPHTDDGELGCGATIAQLSEAGKEIFYVAFSICARSLPTDLPADTLAKECQAATQVLGIKSQNFFLKDYDVRVFKEFRQAILEDLVKLRTTIKPDLVFVPLSEDIHQDHQVIYEEGLRAFKNVSILGYELPWNNIAAKLQAVNAVEEKHIDTKMEALRKYQSQKHRNYFDEGFIRGLAKVRGVQAGVSFAEAFEVIRWVL